MRLDVSCYTCSGGYEINEDSYLAAETVFAVADGLGGHARGEEASACAISCLREQCRGGYEEESILEILEEANRAVCHSGSQGRTTIAAAFVENGIFRFANVGDSRIYYFRNDRLIAQSKDHSLCQAAVDMGTMRPEEIRTSPDRPKLFKVLGEREPLRLKKIYPPISMEPKDAFLICSDGFWEYVYELEMEADLLKSESSSAWMHYMLKRQIQRAGNQGDNYTVICGIVQGEDTERKKIGILKKMLGFSC